MILKVGIIGIGNMGKNHVRIVRELNNMYDLVAVYDPDRDKIHKLDLDYCKTDSIEELIKKSDAVIVAAPSSLHKEIALKVAEEKKHLLVEKPLALSRADAQMISDLYANIGQELMVGHVERYNGAVLELEKILEDEEIIAVNMERCSSMDLRIADTDVLYDLMIHDIDILLHSIFPNKNVEKIKSFGKTVYNSEHIDYVQSIFKFDNGNIASIVSSRATENKIRKINVHCRKSFIEVDLLNKSINIYRKTRLVDTGIMPTAYKQENMIEKVFVPNNEPLKIELTHFYRCIKGEVKCRTDGNSAVECLNILDEIERGMDTVG